MEIFSKIEQGCKKKDHAMIMHLLDSAESEELKRDSFLAILNYYEKEEDVFPVGYSLLFIEWLFKSGDIDTTKDYIVKLNRLGIANKRISELIFEYIIKPDESRYRENFKRNLDTLKKYNLLFTGLAFDFELIKKDVLTFVNYQTDIDDRVVNKQDTHFLIADVIDLEFIGKLLNAGNLLYLVYDDLKKFNYMLLFEDLRTISRYIEEKKIIFFVEDNDTMENVSRFLSKMMVILPNYFVDYSVQQDFRKKVREVNNKRVQEVVSHIRGLRDYYGDKDARYYKRLFAGEEKDIKILLLATIHTTLNQFICRNWYNAFVALGYQAKLLIEDEPYEHMNVSAVIEKTNEFKPDIVFHINFTISSIFKGEHEDVVRKSVLWIMRYRDTTDISCEETSYDYYNMFILPMYKPWVSDLERIDIPGNRIFYTADGIDPDVFTKKQVQSDRYDCDVVSVNHAGGNDQSHIDALENNFKDNNKLVIEIVKESYFDLKEMASNEKFFFCEKSIEKFFNEKLFNKGIDIKYGPKIIILSKLNRIIQAFYRRKVLEWIVDSKITSNIKVWGNGWSNYKKFKDYHMGEASHGEELASIYENSKISISDNPHIPLHERNFEILASGGFPLVKHIEPENNEKDIDSIKNYLKENEEVVLFYSKDDLLNKIQYYLDNPEERERIAGNGRDVVIRNFSSIAIAKRTMEFIKDYHSH